MSISPARAVAFDVLLRVEKEDAFASELLHGTRLEKLSQQDRALCTQLVMGVLRWQSRLDRICTLAAGNPRKLDTEVLIALRLGAFQLGFLDRVPARAAVNESAELVKRARKRSAVGFVNAVLRKVAEQKELFSSEAGALDSPDAIADHFAHPVWLVKRWAAQFGLATAQRICERNQQLPPTSLRVRPSFNNPRLDAALKAEQVEIEPGALMNSARRVISGDVTHSTSFREHSVAIQDEGSQLVAALLGGGERILDCCAAPGGKTSAIAELNPDAEVLAVELHPHRAQLMRSLIQAGNIRILVADAQHLPLRPDFDRILADVPCSGTGTLARNPEIKWRLKSSDLEDLQRRQVGILSSTLERLSVGGRLVYSTCSLEEEENVDVVSQVLKQSPSFVLLPCLVLLTQLAKSGSLNWADVQSLCTDDGLYLRTIPGLHPCDGFFAALIERVTD